MFVDREGQCREDVSSPQIYWQIQGNSNKHHSNILNET